MKVLITGGAGFIGSHLSDAYQERGDEVFCIDDLSTASLEEILNSVIEYQTSRSYADGFSLARAVTI